MKHETWFLGLQRCVALFVSFKIMVTQRFQDDFIAEFRAEQAFLKTQIARFDPLAATLRKRSVSHFLDAGVLLFLEIILYAGVLACIALFFFREKLYPFYLLTRFSRPEYEHLIGKGNVVNLQLLVWILLGVIAVFCYTLARNLRRIRLKNAALARTGTDVRAFLGELLQRKASFDTLEQRYHHVLPMVETRSSVGSVNEVPNPGYEDGFTPQLS